MTDEEKKVYHTVMVDTWRIFIKERQSERYSDAWWQEIIGEYDDYRAKYKSSSVEDFCAELSMAFLNQHERVYKKGKE